MATSGRAARRVAVRISPGVWGEEVERFRQGSPARVAAERERHGVEERGVSIGDLVVCAEEGDDGTRLGGLVKVYVPIAQGPPSQRPFGFLFAPGRSQHGRILRLWRSVSATRGREPAACTSGPTNACMAATRTNRATRPVESWTPAPVIAGPCARRGGAVQPYR